MRKNVLIICIFIAAGLFFLAPPAQAAGSIPKEDISEPVDFTLSDLNSVEISMSSYREKKPVLLIFWTSWCPYCLKGLRDLNQQYPELERSGIEVLAINAGEPRDKAERVARNYGLKFKVLLDPDEETVRYFQVSGIPLYVLVDKKGKVVYRDNFYPSAEINNMIAQ